MSDDEVTLTVAELAEYCRTQAGLLSGRVETIGAEADELLDEIDDDIRTARNRLGESEDHGDLEGFESLDDLEERQAIVDAKRARMAAFQDLAAAYVDLAEELQTVDDWETALERVVLLEQDRDAPVYFKDLGRTTVLEAAAGNPDGE